MDFLERIMYGGSPADSKVDGAGALLTVNDTSEKRFFIVCSHGRTASYWLAAALHKNPDIICGHSKQIPPVPDFFGLGTAERRTIDSIYADFTRIPNDIDEYYDMLEAYGEAKAYGTVHGFVIPEIKRAKHLKRRYAVAHLTRHPLVRLSSNFERRVVEMRNGENVFAHWKRIMEVRASHGEVRDLVEREAPDLSEIEKIAFVTTMVDLLSEARNIDDRILVIPSERLVSDPNYFAWFVGCLTSNTVVPTSQYLAEVFGQGRLNASGTLRPPSASEVVKGWPAWQRKIVYELSVAHGVADSFAPVGYDVLQPLDPANAANGQAEAESTTIAGWRESLDAMPTESDPLASRPYFCPDEHRKHKEGARVVDVLLIQDDKIVSDNNFLSGKPIDVCIAIKFDAPISDYFVGFTISDLSGNNVGTTNSRVVGAHVPPAEKGALKRFRFSFVPDSYLGAYRLSTYVGDEQNKLIDHREGCVALRFVEPERHRRDSHVVSSNFDIL